MKNSALYVLYDYNQDLFITIFCENKSRPQMKCNGKCKLAKMQKEQNEKDAANTLKQLQTEIVYYHPIQSFNLTSDNVSFEELIKKIAYHKNLYYFVYTSQLLKPPSFFLNIR
ncbi:hypothetical protein HZP98_04420 [Elizabethkingia anophelis]|nr:hypothetical protein [Elizabethkingia anophelis]MCT3951267.1 hypothetical protein [Elizabethkingia anophelis]MCT3954810.1 hypothetical protein [Elizabethkingia anophelis]MCT3986764.1 hypothetical protein [Elizabethkingia anophelis]MCT4064947.1 hypothetical protein [Elizabethkingia anophelis]